MNLIGFINGFKQRKGGYIFSAIVTSKVLSFLLSIIILRILSKDDYGNLMYAYTIISFMMPFMGMGIFQSFMKYAPVQEFLFQRKSLFKYSLIGGSVASVFLIILILVLASFATKQVPEAYHYLLAFSFLILAHFIFESVKSYLRIFFLNKAYAQIEIAHSILVFILAVILTYFFGAFGFIISLVLVPLLISLWILQKKRILSEIQLLVDFDKKRFWIYGIYTSLGGLVSQVIFSVDLISIGNLLESSSEIAHYKALSLIPFSLLFLPSAIIKTDFVKLVQEAKNRLYLINYAKSFMSIFFIISLMIIGFVYFFDAWLIELIYGQEYQDTDQLLLVFSVGIAGAFIFRIPFGNIMVAIGWTKISTIISLITLLADLILNYLWIQEWGIIGAAYATSLLLWLSGFAVFIVFLIYLQKLKKEKALL